MRKTVNRSWVTVSKVEEGTYLKADGHMTGFDRDAVFKVQSHHGALFVSNTHKRVYLEHVTKNDKYIGFSFYADSYAQDEAKRLARKAASLAKREARKTTT